MSSTYTPSANRQTSASTTPDRILIHQRALNSFSLAVGQVLNSVDNDDARLRSSIRSKPKMY